MFLFACHLKVTCTGERLACRPSVPHLSAATGTTCALPVLPLGRKGVFQSFPSRVSAKLYCSIIHPIPFLQRWERPGASGRDGERSWGRGCMKPNDLLSNHLLINSREEPPPHLLPWFSYGGLPRPVSPAHQGKSQSPGAVTRLEGAVPASHTTCGWVK